jgi:hypothetical protein
MDVLNWNFSNSHPLLVSGSLSRSLSHRHSKLTAHVGDFGLAIFKAGSASSSLGNLDSSSIGPMGTIGYAAPGNGLSSMHCVATV